jgi:nitrate reductase gamma subunit
MPTLASLDLQARPLVRAILTTLGLCGLVALGSRGGRWLDPALLGYLLASVFACFGVAYRYWEWVERPATWMYFRDTLRLLTSPRGLLQIPRLGLLALDQIFLQRFIEKRSLKRWGAHALIAWGCLLAFAVTFPLVFGWVRFTSEGLNQDRYQTWIFGLPGGSFPVHSFLGFITFHILVVAAVMVIAGCILAFIRRRQDEGDTATQRFDLDIAPLLILVTVSVTGLLLTVSEKAFQGRNFQTIAYIHELSVIFMLLSLPFGKLFHIVQRPAQLGVTLYKEAGEREGRQPCKGCGAPFIRANQRRDLETLFDKLGLGAARHSEEVHHLDLCPRCKRRLVARAQDRRLSGAFDPFADIPVPVVPIVDARAGGSPS